MSDIPIAPPARVGFFGMGAMGCGMAVNLVKAGFTVSAYDPSEDARRNFESRSGARAVATPREACENQDAVVTMLGDGKVVRAALLGGDAPIAAARAVTIVIDCSSSSPPDTLSLGAELAARGIGLIDSPVSGAQKGADDGTLTLMVGGDPDLVKRADAILHAMGKAIFHTGPLGSGHAMKTINNYVAALNLISALQGILVGQKYGLDPEQMVDIINASYGRNAATEFVLKQQVTSGKFAANFKLWLAAKDARVMAETARHVGFSAPLPQDVTALFADAEKTLGRDVDFTNLYKFLDTFWEKKAG
ncbi:NAD(P)-dependent oxidoreductase [Pseudorhodoplanes sp.]|uniref:NAD(P)-dependent oxidoreductase n=1 Tax=Pseudorhodoplanes sp. TaxID=1934341 RepID=UPI003D115B0D